jgi:LAO/AO transport system kinase
LTVASSGDGVPELWDAIASHREYLEHGGELDRRRAQRAGEEALRIAAGSFGKALGEAAAAPANAGVLAALRAREIDPDQAAALLLEEVAREIAGRSHPPRR